VVLAALNLNKATTFSPSNYFMWAVGVIASTLNQGFLFGLFSLLSAPFWITYSFFQGFGYGSSFVNYVTAIAGY
jgi:hypothetical protein